jgi:aldehyde dehydrogenase (NAD+)
VPGIPYPPDREPPELAHLAGSYGLFIDGDVVEPAGGRSLPCVNPATGETLVEVAEADRRDVDAAVAAARRAQDRVWGRTPASQRARYVYRIAEVIEERVRELAVLEALATGTPVRRTREVDVPQAAATFFSYAGWADKLAYAGLGSDPRPAGVAGQIRPSDRPLLALARQVAPALACGTTVVVKPAGTAPLAALRFAEICQQVDLPPGVLNVVTGGDATGAAVAGHPGVDTVSVTGPAEVVRRVAAAVAGTRTRLRAEPGGPVPLLVFDDAPLGEAVEAVVDGTVQPHYGVASHLLVQESVHDEVVAAVTRRMARLRVGDPLDANSDLGPVRTAARLRQVRELVTGAEADGVRRWSPPCELPDRGYWCPPTVLTGVTPAHRVAHAPVPGPVLPVLTFRTTDEAVATANGSRYGPAAAVWSGDGSRVLAVAGRLRAGTVWASTSHRSDPTVPGGGSTQYGGPGRHRHGLEAYLAV